MSFEWDQAKNRANLAKHGVDFADAVLVFEDDLALTRPDLDSRGESRSVIFGYRRIRSSPCRSFQRTWHAHSYYLCALGYEAGA